MMDDEREVIEDYADLGRRYVRALNAAMRETIYGVIPANSISPEEIIVVPSELTEREKIVLLETLGIKFSKDPYTNTQDHLTVWPGFDRRVSGTIDDLWQAACRSRLIKD
jgi:hypothetical protein